jgi:hypothetical protein
MQLVVMKYFGLNTSISRPISCELLHGLRSTVAVMASSLAGVRTVHGRPAFTCAVGVTLPVP